MGSVVRWGERLMKQALVVDESRRVRTVARRILGRYGFEVSEAENCDHGIALWNQWKPNLVIANWYATGADWFFENLRRHPSRPTTILVALLVEIDAGEMEGAARVGVDAFLLKPFTRETLAALLDEVGLLPPKCLDLDFSGIGTPDHVALVAEEQAAFAD
jgi:two-component system chemotaxis response regulator CheY